MKQFKKLILTILLVSTICLSQDMLLQRLRVDTIKTVCCYPTDTLHIKSHTKFYYPAQFDSLINMSVLTVKSSSDTLATKAYARSMKIDTTSLSNRINLKLNTSDSTKIVAGSNVTVSYSGHTATISASGGGGSADSDFVSVTADTVFANYLFSKTSPHSHNTNINIDGAGQTINFYSDSYNFLSAQKSNFTINSDVLTWANGTGASSLYLSNSIFNLSGNFGGGANIFSADLNNCVVSLGDVDVAGNGTKLVVDDTNSEITLASFLLRLKISGLPTSNAGLTSNCVWRDNSFGGDYVLRIVP